MNNQTEQIWPILQRKGIVQREQPVTDATGSPWYVMVLLAFSGWLAAIFILGFIGAGLSFVFDSSVAAGFIGFLMLGAAFGLLQVSANEFVEHLGLAISLAGQALIVYAILDTVDYDEPGAWLLIGIMQLLLTVIMPSFVHRVFSTFVGVFAFSMLLYEMRVPYFTGGLVLLGVALCWFNEFNFPQFMKPIRAIGYGLTLALILYKGMLLFGKEIFGRRFLEKYLGFWGQEWLGETIIAVVTLYAVWRILHRYGHAIRDRLSITALLATLLVCVVSFKVQGITVGMLILCLGFLGSNRVLLGLGIISLLVYISSYYYLLDTTLLYKSIHLLVVGSVLLGVRWALRRMFYVQQEV